MIKIKKKTLLFIGKIIIFYQPLNMWFILSFNIKSAPYSPTATNTEFGVPEIGLGRELASTTRNPETPRTLQKLLTKCVRQALKYYTKCKQNYLNRLSSGLFGSDPIATEPPGW